MARSYDRFPTYAPTGGTVARGLPPLADGVVAIDGPVMNLSEPARFEQLAQLIDTAKLRVPIQRTYPLEQIADALNDLQNQHTQGKLAITIT